MNLSNLPSLITVSGLPTTSRVLAYILTCDVFLTSKHVLLNGNRLQLNPDGSLPQFKPVVTSLNVLLVMPPFSLAFWVVEDVNVPVCQLAL